MLEGRCRVRINETDTLCISDSLRDYGGKASPSAVVQLRASTQCPRFLGFTVKQRK